MLAVAISALDLSRGTVVGSGRTDLKQDES
jgi:hypothetical protein